MGSLVQAPVSESTGNVGNRSLAFGSNVTAGNTLVVVGQGWRSGIWDPSVSDDQSNEWHIAGEIVHGNFKALVAYAYNVVAGATEITLACSSASYYTWAIYEIPGAGGLDPIDVSIAKFEDSWATPNTGSTDLLAQSDEVAFAVVGMAGGSDLSSIAVDSGFTETIEELDIDDHQAGEIDYKELSSITPFDVTWTLSGSRPTIMILVTFNTNTYSPGVLNFGGFEFGDKAWGGGDNTFDVSFVENTVGVVAAKLSFNTEGRTGQGGMLFDDGAGSFDRAGVTIYRPDGANFIERELWFTFYMKMLVNSDENSVFLVIGGISLTWNTSQVAMYVTGSVAGSTPYVFADNDYHKVELHYRSSPQTCELYVDNVLIDDTGVSFSSAELDSEIALNGGSGFGFGLHGKYAYDDWVVSRKRLYYDPQVVVMAPDGNGTYTAWTGTESDVDDLDGAGADDADSTYISSSTSGQAETVTLEASSAASNGTGVVGTIKAVKSQALIKDEGGSSDVSVRLKSGSTDYDTEGSDPGTTYISRGRVYPLDPDGEIPWATTALDALEVGVVNNASVAVRCTALAVMVLTDGVLSSFEATGAVSLPSLRAKGFGPRQVIRPDGTTDAGSWTAVGAGSLHAATNDDSNSSYANLDDGDDPSTMKLDLQTLSSPDVGDGIIIIRTEAIP